MTVLLYAVVFYLSFDQFVSMIVRSMMAVPMQIRHLDPQSTTTSLQRAFSIGCSVTHCVLSMIESKTNLILTACVFGLVFIKKKAQVLFQVVQHFVIFSL